MTEKLRIDKYLWAIRIFKTRTLATKAIDDGKVKCDGNAIKPSKVVAIGEIYDIRTPDRIWKIQVTGLIQNRVGYQEAIQQYVDLTPGDANDGLQKMGLSFHTGKRLSKIGRPTKKQRRDLDTFMDIPDE